MKMNWTYIFFFSIHRGSLEPIPPAEVIQAGEML